MKIHLKVDGRLIPATLADNDTAREFIAMLPITITLHDLFRREKFGALPGSVSGRGIHTHDYEVGDMVIWAPGPDLAIYHRHDGQALSGACHVLGRIDFGTEAFGAPGPLQVTIDVAPQVGCRREGKGARECAHRNPAVGGMDLDRHAA